MPGMRHLYQIVGLVIFLAILGLALRNTQPVTLHYYLGAEWTAPLVLVLMIAFSAGALIGILACLPLLVSQRRRHAAAQKALRQSNATNEN